MRTIISTLVYLLLYPYHSDKKLQNLCKEAATTQIAQQVQLTANKRLDFEIARLKNCGELMKAGIMFPS